MGRSVQVPRWSLLTLPPLPPPPLLLLHHVLVVSKLVLVSCAFNLQLQLQQYEAPVGPLTVWCRAIKHGSVTIGHHATMREMLDTSLPASCTYKRH
jgi:hypothetical protein